jgi:hypothetical protein
MLQSYDIILCYIMLSRMMVVHLDRLAVACHWIIFCVLYCGYDTGRKPFVVQQRPVTLLKQ